MEWMSGHINGFQGVHGESCIGEKNQGGIRS